ncbi:MAG TPA: glycosyltransferase family 4 protein [Alphaproteobacteria bacterium]|nr:glycosyltransferase family 4 protein [Alphaproteobacteria bacterium]
MTARRILFVLNDAPFFLTHRFPLAVAAREAGFEVHVAVPYEKDPVAAITAAGLHHHDIPLRRGAHALMGEIALIAAIWRIVRAIRPDLMHAVTMKPVLYGGLVARFARVPATALAITGLGYLFLREGAAAALQRALVKRLYRFALSHRNAVAIFQNPDDRELFFESRLVNPAIVHMIRGCGVDMTVFAATPEPSGVPVVLFPARIIGDKGAGEFVEAARILKSRGVRARFVLSGRTDADNPTDFGEDAIRAWERDGIVEWQGFSNDMPATLAASNIVCMPSYREGLPRVLIEAAACGRAIITADVPGCREIVRSGENGLLVPVRDAAATAGAIEKLVDDPGMRRRMGSRGREIAEAEFSVAEFVTRSFAAYEAVLPRTAWPGHAAAANGNG